MMVDRCEAPDHWRRLAGRDRHVPHIGSSRARDYILLWRNRDPPQTTVVSQFEFLQWVGNGYSLKARE
jgi:hypothetical protein